MAHPRQNGHLFLSRAIERGDKDTTEKLIRSGVGINNIYLNKSILLHSAIIKFDDLEIITMLLDKGANIHAKDKHNKKPLHVAIENNKTEAVSLLIEKGALDGEDLNSLLLTAIEKNNYATFETLVNYRMQHNLPDDTTCLFNAAIIQGNPKIIKHIMSHCQYLESTDKYIPKELVIKSDLQCKESIELLLKYNFTIHPDNRHDKDFVYGAVENGHLHIVLQLLSFGIDVNMVNSKTGLNLLTIACLNKHHHIVEQLLQHDAQVDEVLPANYLTINNELNFSTIICNFNHFLSLIDEDYHLSDISCLHIAVFNSDPIMTEILLKYGATITNDETYFFIKCLAAQIGSEEIFRILLNHDVKVNFNEFEGKILLRSCIYTDSGRKDSSYNVANIILKKGANIHLHTPNNTFVIDAINNGHRKIVRLFLYYEPDISYVNPDGDTSLHKAIENQFNAEFIKTLLKLNSPVDAVNNNGLTPLFLACKIELDNQFKIIEALLEYNANVNCTDITLRTPLHSVCDAQNPRLVKALLEKGANPNAKNDGSQTPLHVACKVDNYSTYIIQLLLEYDANIEAIDADGWTPLFVACYSGSIKALQCLLDNNAYVNHTDLQNLTALHIAVEQKSIEMTSSLLKCGANINSLDRNDQTALQIALELYRVLHSNRGNDHRLNRMNNYKEIIKMLKTQVVKFVIAGLKVNNEDWKIVYVSDDTLIHEAFLEIDRSQLIETCLQEINEMKKEIIYLSDGRDYITFDVLLKKHDGFLRRFVDNDELQTTLELPLYDDRYPLYIDIVRGRFRDVKYRHDMINLAKEYFHDNVCQRMPSDCTDKVFEYLNVAELKMFIEAIEPFYG